MNLGSDNLDFKTAIDMNNDLILLLKAINDVSISSEFGKDIQEKFSLILKECLEQLRNSIIVPQKSIPEKAQEYNDLNQISPHNKDTFSNLSL